MLPENMTTFTSKVVSPKLIFIPQGGNCAVVGVKAELGAPHPSSPSEGKLEFFVDWLAIIQLRDINFVP